MAGVETTKLSGAYIAGMPKGVSVLKHGAAVACGPPAGVVVMKMSAAFIMSAFGLNVNTYSAHAMLRLPKGVSVTTTAGAVALRLPRGISNTTLCAHVMVRPPRDVFRVYANAGYASIIIGAPAKSAVYKTSSYAAIWPGSAYSYSTSAFVSLERTISLVWKVASYATLRPNRFRTHSNSAFAVLHTFPFFLRTYKASAFATLQYVPPLAAYSIDAYASIFAPLPERVWKTSAYTTLKEPRIHVSKLQGYAVIPVELNAVYKLNRYVTLKPRPPNMFPRKITGYAAVAGPPPARSFKMPGYVALSPPPPSIWVWKAQAYAAMEELPPMKAQLITAFASIEIPPPVFLYRFGSYATIVPRPTGTIAFKLTKFIALGSTPPHVYKLAASAVLVPLGSIGLRGTTTKVYATLTPGTPVSSLQYPLLLTA